MANAPILSICIPTYNRGEFLQETLISIKKAAEDIKHQVEICISDNASEDNTAEIIETFRKSTDDTLLVRYHRNKENLGADRNFLKVIEIASGELCWFLGSDDLAIDSSLKRIFEIHDSHKSDIYIFDRINFSFKKEELESWAHAPYRVTHQNIINYIGYLDKLGGIFSYISSIVFKRCLWNEVVQNDNQIDRFVGTQYIHTYILFRMISDGACMYYTHLPLVLNRVGNSSFLSGRNHFRRILLDYAYLDIADQALGISAKEAIESLLYRKNTHAKLLRAKLFLPKEDRPVFDEFMNRYFKKRTLICKLVPNPIIKLMLYLYQIVR